MNQTHYELECFPGLEPDVQAELLSVGAKSVCVAKGVVAVLEPSKQVVPRLKKLRTVRAVYWILPISGGRPTAILGHQNLQTLLQLMREVLASWSSSPNTTVLTLQAAGSNSSVMRRIREQIAQELLLPVDENRGSLKVRVRRSLYLENGWDVAIRLTPQQQGKRGWRTVNYRGALHATAAASLVNRLRLQGQPLVLNTFCGSGTLFIELLLQFSRAQAVALDCAMEAGMISLAHAVKAGVGSRSRIVRADAAALPLKSSIFDVVMADPPWGEAHLTRQQIRGEAGLWLDEMLRVLRPGGSLLLVTQAQSDWSQLFERFKERLELLEEKKFFQGGFHPSAFLLKRREGASLPH